MARLFKSRKCSCTCSIVQTEQSIYSSVPLLRKMWGSAYKVLFLSCIFIRNARYLPLSSTSIYLISRQLDKCYLSSPWQQTMKNIFLVLILAVPLVCKVRSSSLQFGSNPVSQCKNDPKTCLRILSNDPFLLFCLISAVTV